MFSFCFTPQLRCKIHYSQCPSRLKHHTSFKQAELKGHSSVKKSSWLLTALSAEVNHTGQQWREACSCQVHEQFSWAWPFPPSCSVSKIKWDSTRGIIDWWFELSVLGGQQQQPELWERDKLPPPESVSLRSVLIYIRVFFNFSLGPFSPRHK